ncbi:hypothetical protein BFJ63_vAg16668 [Fusarium oxysporum f. sp. narcissi]|uniref:Sodium/calcium exchanger membrane region domain-containing protein n=1 Tax=Fusarium oxysporum f. sp. narcissi TaxID=451672 RepID=A0A4V1RY57_FUSOX|nr:hypothetical protein BFJ63_vAg16668 [Fusarium oxysporum f. sp. narcissi]
MSSTDSEATFQPENSLHTFDHLQDSNQTPPSPVSRRRTFLDDPGKQSEATGAVRRAGEFIARNAILLLTPVIFILLAISVWDFARPGSGHRAFWINFFGILSQAANLTLLFEDLQLLIGEAMAVLISPIANNFVELSLLIAAVREGAHSLNGAGLYGGILINVGLVFLSAALIQALRWPQDTSMSWCALLNTPAKTSRNGVPEPLPMLTYIGMAMLPASLFFDTLLRGATRLLPGRETTFHYTFQALAWLKLLPYLALVAAQFYEQVYPDHFYKLIDDYLPCWIVNCKERAAGHSDQGGEGNTAVSTAHDRVHDEETCLNQSDNEQNPLLGPKSKTNDGGEEEDEEEKKHRLLDMMLKRWKHCFPQNTRVWMSILVSSWMVLNSVATAVQGDWLADGVNRWLGKPKDPVTLGLIPLVGAAPEHIIAVVLVILSPYRFPDVIITTVLSGLNLSNFVGPIVQLYAWHIAKVWIELEDDWRHPMIACIMSLSIFVSYRHGVVRLDVILLNIALLTVLYAADFSDAVPR